MKTQNLKIEIMQQIMPVGYIFEVDPSTIVDAPDLSTPELVCNYFGFGTWERYGEGRVLQGANSSYPIGQIGGESTHVLTKGELPQEPVEIPVVVENGGNITLKEGRILYRYPGGTTNYAGAIRTENLGNGEELSIMQPYINVYRYRRIA